MLDLTKRRWSIACRALTDFAVFASRLTRQQCKCVHAKTPTAFVFYVAVPARSSVACLPS